MLEGAYELEWLPVRLVNMAGMSQEKSQHDRTNFGGLFTEALNTCVIAKAHKQVCANPKKT